MSDAFTQQFADGSVEVWVIDAQDGYETAETVAMAGFSTETLKL
jgi:hypothetical protein